MIGTGGIAELIAAETDCIEVVDQRPTLDGLRLIHELNTWGESPDQMVGLRPHPLLSEPVTR